MTNNFHRKRFYIFPVLTYISRILTLCCGYACEIDIVCFVNSESVAKYIRDLNQYLTFFTEKALFVK